MTMMLPNKIHTAFFAIILTFCPVSGLASNDTQENANEAQLFSAVLDKVREEYVDVPSDTQLAESSIEELLDNLDPHSTYLDKDDYEALQGKTSGDPGGLGIDINMDQGAVEVIATLDGSPARKAGIQTGDKITSIDYQPTTDMALDKVIQTLRGAQGSEIVLGVVRDPSQHLEFNLQREEPAKSSVRSLILDQGIGYIRISTFQAETSQEFISAINKLQDEEPLEGLVLDLRNNPGGLMPVSVEVADSLIDQGLLLYTEGRKPKANQQYYATYGDLINGAPIVVLINGGSASASEIVAGALQDQERATIIGTQSFGKGSVQSVIPLGDGRGIKLTTAHYLTPSGRFIHGQGIEPDIIIEQVEQQPGSNDNQITRAVQLLKKS
jgi:carboxyl-terminal processing protease